MNRIDKSSLQVFTDFEEAEVADQRERWAMSPVDLLIALETMRTYMYPDGESPPRLQRVLVTAEQA